MAEHNTHYMVKHLSNQLIPTRQLNKGSLKKSKLETESHAMNTTNKKEKDKSPLKKSKLEREIVLVSSNNDEAVVKGYEINTETIKEEEIKEAFLLPMLLSPFNSSDEDVDNTPKIKDVTKYKASAPSTSLLEKKKHIFRLKTTDIEGVTEYEVSLPSTSQSGNKKSICKLKSTETKMLNDSEAVAPCTVLLGKKKRIAHRKTSETESHAMNTTNKKEKDKSPLKKSKLDIKGVTEYEVSLPSTSQSGNKKSICQLKSTESKMLNDFEAVTPSTVLLEKKKQIAYRQTSGIRTMCSKKYLKHEQNSKDTSYPNRSNNIVIKEPLPSDFNTIKQQNDIDFFQSESNPYSQSIPESSDTDESNILIIDEDPMIHNDHYDPSSHFFQSESSPYSLSISESLDSEEDPMTDNVYYDLISHSFRYMNEPKSTMKIEDQPSTSSGSGSKFIQSFFREEKNITEEPVQQKLIIKTEDQPSTSSGLGRKFIPSHYRHKKDITEEPVQQKLIIKTEDQPSTSSGLGRKFIPSHYRHKKDITEESVQSKSIIKTEDQPSTSFGFGRKFIPSHYRHKKDITEESVQSKSIIKTEDQPSTSSGFGRKFIPSHYRHKKVITEESVQSKSIIKTEDQPSTSSGFGRKFIPSHYRHKKDITEESVQSKSIVKTEDQPSTSSGFGRKFIPSHYRHKKDITEESVQSKSIVKTEDQPSTSSGFGRKFIPSHYRHKKDITEESVQSKSIVKTEDQPSTSSGFGSEFVPSFYREREDITEEPVPNQSLTKPTELEVEDIIQIEKSCDLTFNATHYVRSNVVELALGKDYKTRVENKKWKKLCRNLGNEITKCMKLYNVIFQDENQPLDLNLKLLKNYSVEAQVKSLLKIFPSDNDVTLIKPIFKPKNKDEAIILDKERQYPFIRFITVHLIEHNRMHPFLKCLANEVFYYIKNFKGIHLKGSKCIQVTELLAVLCHMYNLYDIARAFIYDCLYWLKMMAFPLIYSMVKIYPQVLPRSNIQSLPLNKVFVHCILETPKKGHHMYLNYLLPLKNVLWNYYKCPKDSENPLTLLKFLLRKITEPGVTEAVLLLCKKQNCEWTYKNVVKYLLDFFVAHKIKNEYYAIASMRLIGMVMKAFPRGYSDEKINTVISILESLLFDPKGFIPLKEEIALALCHLARFNLNKCVTTLLEWQPSNNIVSESNMKVMANVLNMLDRSECEALIYQKTNIRKEISYENLSVEDESPSEEEDV